MSLQIGLATRHEEAARGVQSEEPLEIEIPAVHHIERAGLRQQLVEDVDLVHLAVADMDKSGDIAPQIEQGMQFDSGLGRAKRSPREDRQAQIDGRRVESVDRLFEIDAERLLDIELASHRDQALREAGVDAPVAHLVRIRQRAARNPAADPHVIKLVALGSEASLDIPQALAVSKLGERQAEKLFEAREALDLVLAVVRRDAPAKRGERKVTRQLRKNQLAGVHGYRPQIGSSQGRTSAYRSRNRDQKKSRFILDESIFYGQQAH